MAGLVTSVDGSVDELTRSFALITLYVGLTDLGLREWRDVASAVFSYLRLLREQGLPSHAYTDERTMRDIGFRFAEPAAPQSFAQPGQRTPLSTPRPHRPWTPRHQQATHARLHPRACGPLYPHLRCRRALCSS